MKRNILIVFVFSIFSAAISNAQQIVFQGKIGNSDIYLQMDSDFLNSSNAEDFVTIRYFYVSSLKDIVMSKGKRDGDQYTFYMGDSEAHFSEKFILKKETAGKFKGIWVNEQGKLLNVTLSPVNVEAVKNPYEHLPVIQKLKQEDVFDYIRSCFVVFKPDSVTQYKGKSFEWYEEVHCETPFFRLRGNVPDSILRIINPILEDIHWSNILGQLNCSTAWAYSEGNGIYYKTNIRYLTENLMGFDIFYSWDCGGAHPDFYTQGYLIDLHSGKQYELDEILTFDESVTTESQSDFGKFSDYRTHYFAPKLFELIDQIENFKTSDSEEYCDYTELDNWDFPAWYFSEDGIVFIPSFPRVNRACEEGFPVPFADLRMYKHPDFPYIF